MAEVILETIKSKESSLESRIYEDLNLAVQDLEAKIIHLTNKDSARRKFFWIQLVRSGHQLRNEQLCLLVIRKLELFDLLFAIETDVSHCRTLIYVADYFHFHTNELIADSFTQSHQQRNVNSFSYMPTSALDAEINRQCDFKNIGTSITIAKDQEISDNFEASLTSYEQMGLQYDHFIRLTMKNLMHTARPILNGACKKIPVLQNIWFEYLAVSNHSAIACKFSRSCGDESSCLKHCELTQSLVEKQHELIRSLPKYMSEFIVIGHNELNVKKQLGLVSSSKLSLSLTQEVLMAELITSLLMHQDHELALRFAFCLNEANSLLGCLRHFDYWIPLVSKDRSSVCLCASSLVACLMTNVSQVSDESKNEIIGAAYLKLGLLEELMRLACTNVERWTDEILNQVEIVTESNFCDKLHLIDTTINEATLGALFQQLKFENNKDLNTGVVSILLNAIKVYIMKLRPNFVESSSDSLLHLEGMFNSLSLYLDELAFGATDKLVRATNNLVTTLRNKLDVLADSQIIRESFKNLVDTVASRCLIEAKYKSAAILYSQIDDNVNAIKSLMRTGEVQTVVDFALLVRDITVHRITINFMKHLKVDPEKIEVFLLRTKI